MTESEELDLDLDDVPDAATDPEKDVKPGGKPSFFKKKSVRWALVGTLLLVFIGVGGYFTWSMFLSEPEPAEPPPAEVVELPEPVEEKTPRFEKIFPMDIFENVRLADADINRTLTVKIDLEYDKEQGWDELMEKEPDLHESILGVLKGLTSKILLDVEGRTALKYKLIDIVNDQLEDRSIRNVYFTEFIVRTYKL